MGYLIEIDDLRSRLIYPTPGMYPSVEVEAKRVQSRAAAVGIRLKPSPEFRQEELNLSFEPQAAARVTSA